MTDKKFAFDQNVRDLASAFGQDMGEVRGIAENARISFANRDQMISEIPIRDISEGRVIYAGGISYEKKSESLSIPDMPGWIPQGKITPEHFGAVGDGVTDDLPAFNAMVAAGHKLIGLRGNYRLSGWHQDNDALFELTPDAAVTIDGGATWSPRAYAREGATPFSRKVNPLSSNPVIPPEIYSLLPDSYQSEDYWINQWGHQEEDTDGFLSGARPPGKIKPGQSRLARSGANAHVWRGLHSGEGDGYLHYNSMFVVPHSRGHLIKAWGGQNSGGADGGQVTAGGAKVNLYYSGDRVLKDNGHSDVSLLGEMTYLTRTGANSGDYHVPRFGYYVLSDGTLPTDAAYIAAGKHRIGLDLTGVESEINAAITILGGQRIYFDAAAPNPGAGQFSSQTGGTYYIHKASGPDRLEVVVNTTPVLRLYPDRTEVRPSLQSNNSFRVFGDSSTAMAAVGQIGTNSYFSAHTIGAEATTLVLRAADETGTEQVILSMGGSGRITAPRMLYFADNDAALSAGRTAGDIYATPTGELRIVV